MTEQQVINEITSKPKFYLYAEPPIPQSTASNFMASYRRGISKQSTIDAFLERFGYSKISEAQYSKDLEGKPNNLKTK